MMCPLRALDQKTAARLKFTDTVKTKLLCFQHDSVQWLVDSTLPRDMSLVAFEPTRHGTEPLPLAHCTSVTVLDDHECTMRT